MRLRGFVPLCGLLVVGATSLTWQYVPDVALLARPTPLAVVTATPGLDVAPVVQAYRPFSFTDAQGSGATFYCVANAGAQLYPPITHPLPGPMPTAVPTFAAGPSWTGGNL